MTLDQRRPSRLARMTRALRSLWPAEPPQIKASAVGPLIAIEPLGQPVWMPRDYAAFAREGMMQNAVVYRAVRMIAEAAASVPLLLYEGEKELAEHPLLALLARPSPAHTATDLLEAWLRLPARRRQRLPRGGRGSAGGCANCTCCGPTA
jgi:hypothetical protein